MGLKQVVKQQLQKRGYKLVRIEKGKTGDISIDNGVIIDTNIVPFCQNDFNNRDEKLITMNWVIPPLGKGAGGLNTIFRVIGAYRTAGIRSKIYVYGDAEYLSSYELKHRALEYFGVDLGDNEIYGSIDNMTYADATMATSWITAYVVRNFNNTVSKFYFVQDFEPYFFPVGSEYYLAENTYKMGFRAITAGDWLKNKLISQYGMEAESFSFAYDKNYYKPMVKSDDKNRVFFYARPFTERRGFEIAVLAFTLLARRGFDFEVVFAGQKLDDYQLHFNYIDMGTLSFDKLAECYSQSDICFVFSGTNLSLVPLEVMACNSVVMCNAGENNEWMLNDKNAILINSDPIEIADKLEYYLTHKDQLNKFKEDASRYIADLSWEKAYERSGEYIIECVKKDIDNINLK